MTEGPAGAPRRRAPALAAAAAVLLVLGVAGWLVPRVVAGPGRDAAPAGTGTACVTDPDAPVTALADQDARWVRFCPLADAGLTQRVRHPQGVLTGDLAAAAARTLWETQVERPTCVPDAPGPGPTGLFRVEVGLPGGRVAELTGDTGCSTRDQVLFSQLETALLMDAAAGSATVPPPAPVTCPRRFTTTRTNADGDSADELVETADQPWQSTLPLLPRPAVAADVCAYTGGGGRRRLVDQWQVGTVAADEIRAAATTGHDRGARTDCEPAPGLTSYVVVLTDTTGTARTLTLDPTRCGVLDAATGTPATDTWLGLARPGLVRLVARSRP